MTLRCVECYRTTTDVPHAPADWIACDALMWCDKPKCADAGRRYRRARGRRREYDTIRDFVREGLGEEAADNWCPSDNT